MDCFLSMQVFICIQTSLFICNFFGCKLWLQLNQNYVRDCSQAFFAQPSEVVVLLFGI